MIKTTSLWLLTSMVLCHTLTAQEISFEAGVGYRQDKLSWSLGGGQGGPSTLSKLTWSDIRSVDFQGELEATFCDGYYMRLDGNYGHVYHGRNSDKDYLVHPQTFEDFLFFETHADASKGCLWDVSIAGSCLTYCLCDCWELRPLLGYSIHNQRLHMNDGVIVVDAFFPQNIGLDFPDLDSRYNTFWSGPWIGFDLDYTGCSCWSFSTSQEIHALYYHAKGHWNLREDIVGDFHHNGWGWGYFTKFAVDYEIGCGWRVGAQVKYNYCRMNDGHDRTTILDFDSQNPSEIVESVGHLKHSVWNSFAILITGGYTF